MYGLPEKTDLGFIVGQSLIQACFGTNDLILRFDGTEGVTITISSSISCTSHEKVGTRTENFGAEAAFILGLLDVPIDMVNVLNQGTLELISKSGSRFYIYDDSPQFESYTIKHQGKLLVI